MDSSCSYPLADFIRLFADLVPLVTHTLHTYTIYPLVQTGAVTLIRCQRWLVIGWLLALRYTPVVHRYWLIVDVAFNSQQHCCCTVCCGYSAVDFGQPLLRLFPGVGVTLLPTAPLPVGFPTRSRSPHHHLICYVPRCGRFGRYTPVTFDLRCRCLDVTVTRCVRFDLLLLR